ncbi:crotonase/enoyl-CoA hydratase family protein [Phreatobacter sp.]|uniref:crotonase/enoyl-CoA hydratase family protein n=1 Tax=Phreatobacter sp. TaxID=1966341 RepID=UPI0025E932D8|nr:crotonase/enoyl-CoA hydratase family protein [Phreatobacter sp.]
MTASLASEGRITCNADRHVLMVGISRPDKRNAFSLLMMKQLAAAYQRLEDDPNLRVGLLHAEGDHFSAGLQLDQFQGLLHEGRHLTPAGLVDPFDLFPPLRSKPIVVALQGICFTIAIELALAADIVVASEDCRFGQIEVRRGIFPNHGATLRLVERAGWGGAMRYLLTGDEFDARTAQRLGLVQEVVSPGRQYEVALDIALTIAQQAPLAVQTTLRNARKALREGIAAATLDLGPEQQRLLDSQDAAEGLASFLERRKAIFSGR